jgi:ACS family hexuronate transporter-like MFS transporter
MTAPNPYASPTTAPQPATPDNRTSTWAWYVCILLLFGTVVNYMDRLTANTLSVEIIEHFGLSKQQYGNLELGFGLAFATGCLLFGWLVDRLGVYWLYPFILVGWSAMGFLTGLSQNYAELLVLRTLLGLFEAGHFPCGLKTVQLLLAPRDRMMGNSLLQSGTAVGAIAAPQAIKILMARTGDWRTPFLVIGAAGCVWVIFWFAAVRPRDLRDAAARLKASLAAGPASSRQSASFLEVILTKKFLALVIMVICINQNWHLFRVWLPMFLRESRGYDLNSMLDFATGYYIAADIGVLSAGAAATWLTRRHWSVYASRLSVYAFCACLTTMTTAAAMLPAGPMLLVSLLAVAFGGLGCFSAYYSLTQDLSHEHQGKVSGLLGTCTWLVTSPFHKAFGWYLDETGNYDVAVGAMGWLPMISLVALVILWRPEKSHGTGPAATAYPSADEALAPASSDA